jgi:hypothetical protein
MKNKSCFVSALVWSLFILPIDAGASLDGLWEGTGTFSDTEVTDYGCENIGAMFTRTETRLEYYFFGLCDTQAFRDAIDFDVIQGETGDELWLDGEKVGRVRENSFEFSLDQDGFDYHYRARFEVHPDGRLEMHDEVKQGYYWSRLDAVL